MKDHAHTLRKVEAATATALLILAVLAALATLLAIAAPAEAEWTALVNSAPGARPVAALPAPLTCTPTATGIACDLYAASGTLSLPGLASPLTIWGFTGTSGGAATLPGPAIEAVQGQTLQVTLHNDLAGQKVSLAFPGLEGWQPDLVGVDSGSSGVYTVALPEPGTYLYEAGLTLNGPRQVAMGMYGVLVVRPDATTCPADTAVPPTWTGCAYNSNSQFDTEELVVLSEIDPALNANPATFRMEDFDPTYRLINGAVYQPGLSAPILMAPGTTTLLRYANAGLQHHAMGLLGLRQTVVGADGVPLTFPRTIVSELVWPGQTLDALVTMPETVAVDSMFPLYDASLRLNNAAQPGFGGMLAFVKASTGAAAIDAGPATSNVSITPARTTGLGGATLAATLDDTGSADPDNITAIEYFIDAVGANGTGIQFSDYTQAPVVAVSIPIAEADLLALESKDHTFYIHGMDVHGTWGAVGSAVLRLDYTGPDSTGLKLTPNPSKGDVAVALQATGDDTAHGSGNVVSGRYSLNGGATIPLTLNHVDQPIASLTATLTPPLGGFSEGIHTVAVEGQDDLLNWGAAGVANLLIDKSGPTATAAVLPTTLTFPNPGVATVRLSGTLSDPIVAGVQSTVAAAEGFIDTLGAPGTGFPMFPLDGLLDEFSEDVYYNIPIANFTFLSQGNHPLHIRGKDASGNWGPAGSTSITINRGLGADTTGPTLTNVRVTPNPANGATSVVLTAIATDANYQSNIAAAEWRRGNSGPWTPMSAADGAFDETVENLTATIDITGWRNKVTISVRASAPAGVWGPTASVVLRVTR